MGTVTYGCTALVGTNKVGILKPDADGRYTMVLGALEYPNSVGDIYTLESAKSFFQEGSSLLRRIKNGQLRAEYGHPKFLPGMSEQEYMQRILTIDEENVCAHISEVTIDYESVKDPATGKKIITFIGKIKPCGPKGHILKEILDDPKQNCAFSVRSLTMNRQVGFRQHKDFTQIVCWDYVNEPGLAPANKYAVPTLESHAFDVKLIEAMTKKKFVKGVSLESATLLKDTLQRLQTREKPTYMTW